MSAPQAGRLEAVAGGLDGNVHLLAGPVGLDYSIWRDVWSLLAEIIPQ
jgi:hypothetical protein